MSSRHSLLLAIFVVAVAAAPPAARAQNPHPEIEVWIPSDKGPWLNVAVRQWTEARADRPVRLKVMGSVTMERALARGAEGRGSLPHAAVLASSAQLDNLKNKGLKLNGPVVPIARTYLVVAAWDETARKLGWPDKPVSLQDLAGPAGEGTLVLGHTHPEFSYSGLLAVLLKARAFTGSDAPTAEGLTKAAATWRRLESGQTAYGSSTGFYKDYLLAHPEEIQAAFLYESSVIQARRDNPKAGLCAIYPSEGTYLVDSPYAVPAGHHQSEETEKSARYFLQHLLDPGMQLVAMSYGFRPADPKVKLSPLVFDGKNGIRPEDPKVLPAPSADTVREVVGVWRKNVKKKAQVALVLDVSRSMEGKKMESLLRAAKGLVQALDADERIALFTFERKITLLHELALVGESRAGLTKSIDGIQMGGGTYLVEATRQAVDYMAEKRDPARTSVVIVMTDGRDPRYRLHEPAFLEQEKAIRSRKDVLVFTIGVGDEKEVDPAMLQKLASVPTGFTLIGGDGIERVFEEEIRAQF